MPTESALCAEFDASRYTVREALRLLVEQGFVTRRQKSGTVVIATARPRGYVQSVNTLAELFQFALDTHYVVHDMAMVEIDAEVAASVAGEAGSRWLRIGGIRTERPGGAVICTTVSYVPERLAWIGPELRQCIGPFYAHLETRSGEAIADAVQEIKAERMAPHIAVALQAPPDSVALCLLRRYASIKGTMIASFNWHWAERFVYRMHLQAGRIVGG